MGYDITKRIISNKMEGDILYTTSVYHDKIR